MVFLPADGGEFFFRWNADETGLLAQSADGDGFF